MIWASIAPYIIGLIALIGGALGLYAKGRGDAKAKAETKTLRERSETLGRMADAPQSDTADDALVWLRDRKPTGNLHRNRK